MKIVILAMLLTQLIYANMYHLKLLSDKTPDLSNIESFGHDIGDKWETNNEKAIILGYWLDQLTTYGEPLYFSRQWDDPIAFINNNEYGMCSDLTLLLNALGEGTFGFTGRRHELSGLEIPIQHTVPELVYDGTFHFIDPSFGNAYGHSDDGNITSLEEYALNPYFSRHNTPTALTRDSDGNGSIKAWFSIDSFGWSIDRFRHDEYSPDLTWQEKRTEGYYGVHRFDISIEDYEYYTRYWHKLDGLEKFDSHDFMWPHYNYGDTGDYSWNDSDVHHEHRANGLWVYEPDLSDSSSYESSKNIIYSQEGVYPSAIDTPSSIVFKIDSANFVTGVLIEANIRREADEDSLIIEASSSGGNYWFPIWDNTQKGSDISISKNISNMIKGTLQSQDLRHVTDFLVRVKMNSKSSETATKLNSIKISTVTLLGKSSLPKLTLGTNEITIAKANNHSLYQTKSLNPVLSNLENGTNDKINWNDIEVWKLYAKDYINLKSAHNSGNMYTSLWKTSSDVGWVTYELDAPRPIKKARLGGSFIIRENSEDKVKIKYRIFNGIWGAWEDIAMYDWASRNVSDKRENQAHIQEWDIVETNVTKVQFKTEIYKYAHLEALHMEIDYEAKVTSDKPLYITYNWTEYDENSQGDLPLTADEGITRTYLEKVVTLPHTFTINTGGDIQPRMNWVSMNLEGNNDPINDAPLGYSDGIDKGNNDYIPMINYDIGKIISIGKSITLSTLPESGTKEQLVDGRIIATSDGHRGNEGGGKVEVQNDNDDIVKFSSGIGSLEIVIDLGSVQSVGGIRVDAYKKDWEDFFPDSIEVEIAENDHFTKVATDLYKSAKYAHNLYPVAWSLPINSKSIHSGYFPNYGLLSNYIFIPFDKTVQARYIKIKVNEQNYNNNTKGFTLSEVHVYDKLIANQWSPKLKHSKPIVVPKPISIELEAESATLVSPMIVVNDEAAFNGSYITNSRGSESATYTFTVPTDGVYTIWGRYIAENDSSNSFFVKMDDEIEDIWDMEVSSTWRWDKVKGRDNGGVKTYNLQAGTHTFTIRGREDDCKLDAISITNIDKYLPEDTPPVAPSNLTFTNITKNSVTLNWQDNSLDEIGFKIFRNEQLIDITDVNITSYTDSTLDANTTYSYTIKTTR